jgi:TctA family transporter
MVEENFRRAMLVSRGDLAIFVERPISAGFISACAILVVAQIFFSLRAALGKQTLEELQPVVGAGMPILEDD